MHIWAAVRVIGQCVSWDSSACDGTVCVTAQSLIRDTAGPWFPVLPILREQTCGGFLPSLLSSCRCAGSQIRVLLVWLVSRF